MKYRRLDLRTGLDDEDAAVADDALDVLGSAERALERARRLGWDTPASRTSHVLAPPPRASGSLARP